MEVNEIKRAVTGKTSRRWRSDARPTFDLCRVCVFVFLTVWLLVGSCPLRAEEPSGLDGALSDLGVGLQDIRIDRVDMDRLTNGVRPGSVLGFLFAEPMQTKAFMQRVRADLLGDLAKEVEVKLVSPLWQGIDGIDGIGDAQTWPGGVTSLASTMSRMSRWGDRVVRRTLLGNPVEVDVAESAKPGALVDAVAAIHDRAGVPLSEPQRAALGSAAAEVPVAVARAAALLLRVADRAVLARDRAIRHLDRTALEDAGSLSDAISLDDRNTAPSVRDSLAGFEVGHLFAAAQELSIAAHLAARLLSLTPPADASFRWETPLGRIVIDGQGDTTYADDGTYLLILDTVGNDVYRAGGGAVGLDNPVSILIDVRGSDRYVTDHDLTDHDLTDHDIAATTQPAVREHAVYCAFGAGVLGVGILIDVQGDDVYEADTHSLGSGWFGVGVLDDWSGEDRYSAVSDSQGAAMAGIGLLVDRAGNDTYDAYTTSQAFAQVGGVGALIDLAGDDRYTANDVDIRFPSSQSPQHNDSMCQGAAVGHRADYLDGYSLPGGVAVLLDAGGDDTYTCGVFGQGTGYWMGVGMLIDVGGSDSYTGQWYVQGAAAHFAVGALLDESGDDRYDARMATSQGTGHDLSLGFLADLAGNDTYRSGDLTMGAGNEGGIGILIDASGNDNYTIHADRTLGYANAPRGVRATMPTVGIFLDAGGTDVFSQPYAGDNLRWGIGPDRALTRMAVPRIAIGVDTVMSQERIEALWRRRM